MSSPTANCRLFGNLQYGHSPRRSQFVGDFGAGRPRSIADCPGRWRREWDSNPRYGFPHTRFPSVRLKPLGHLSGCPLLKGQDAFCKGARAGGRKFPQLPEYKRLFRPMIDLEDATGLNPKRCPDDDLLWWRPTVVAAKHGRGGIMIARALLFLSMVAIAASTT